MMCLGLLDDSSALFGDEAGRQTASLKKLFRGALIVCAAKDGAQTVTFRLRVVP
jgi:hypothetical protein